MRLIVITIIITSIILLTIVWSMYGTGFVARTMVAVTGRRTFAGCSTELRINRMKRGFSRSRYE
jgi:hypothetical protein